MDVHILRKTSYKLMGRIKVLLISVGLHLCRIKIEGTEFGGIDSMELLG